MTVEQEQQNAEKAMSEQFADILERLSFDQKRFIIARQETSTDKDAAESIGMKPETIYRWRQEGVPIDDALDLMVHDGVIMALDLRRSALAKAMAVKVGGLDSDDERIRQGVATEITEAELGKAQQFIDFTTQGEKVGSTDDDIAKAVAIIQGSGNSSTSGGAD